MKSLVTVLLALLTFVPNVTAASAWPEIAKELRKSLVYISYDVPGACTGVVVDAFNKRVQTAAHCTKAAHFFADGLEAQILINDIKNDLVVFEVPDLPMGYRNAKLAANNPEPAEDMLAVGFGEGVAPAMVRRTILSLEKFDLKDSGPYLTFDTRFVRGMSGGPVVNANGEVTAIISRSSDYMGLGIPANVVRKSCGNMWSLK